jgi:hypothetical protein
MSLPSREKATDAASVLLKDAGLSVKEVNKLQQLPVERLLSHVYAGDEQAKLFGDASRNTG